MANKSQTAASQMWLGIFPKITQRHGKEWMWARDSTGFGRFFSRPIGSNGPFRNEFAGAPDDPRSTCGNGECVDEYGNLVPCP